MIREAGAADVPELVALAQRRCPHVEAWTIATVFSQDLDGAPMAFDADGGLVGFGTASHRPGSPEEQRVVQVWVDRDAEGGGLGRQLHELCLAALPPGTSEAWSRVYDDDERDRQVAEHWGYETVQRSIASFVEIEGAVPPLPPPGVTLEACGALGFPDPEACAAMLAASQTNPEAQTSHLVTFAEMEHWVDDGETPVATLVRVDGVPAAIAFAIVSLTAGEGGVGYTGVDPAFRGRGLAVLAKRHVHHQAAVLGVRRLGTDNEEHNTGIRRVNAELGYRVAYGYYRMRKRLQPEAC